MLCTRFSSWKYLLIHCLYIQNWYFTYSNIEWFILIFLFTKFCIETMFTSHHFNIFLDFCTKFGVSNMIAINVFTCKVCYFVLTWSLGIVMFINLSQKHSCLIVTKIRKKIQTEAQRNNLVTQITTVRSPSKRKVYCGPETPRSPLSSEREFTTCLLQRTGTSSWRIPPFICQVKSH